METGPALAAVAVLIALGGLQNRAEMPLVAAVVLLVLAAAGVVALVYRFVVMLGGG